MDSDDVSTADHGRVQSVGEEGQGLDSSNTDQNTDCSTISPELTTGETTISIDSEPEKTAESAKQTELVEQTEPEKQTNQAKDPGCESNESDPNKGNENDVKVDCISKGHDLNVDVTEMPSKIKEGSKNDTGDGNSDKNDDNHGKSGSEHSPTGPHAKTPRFVYILSCFATIGGFLLGYDIAIVAGSMLFIEPYFELSTLWQEAVVSGTIGAAAVAALVSGWLTDKLGRKRTIMTSSVVFTAGGVVMGVAPTKQVLLFGRIISGLGVGMASVVVPVYVAEASPVHIRGRLVSCYQLLVNFGIVVSSLMAGAFSYVEPDGWRYMLGMAAVPGVLQFIGFLFMPESPRWLVDKNRIEDARKVLQRMRGTDDVSTELDDIRQTVEEAGVDKGIQHLMKILRTPHVRRSLFIGCCLVFFQQWCGINTVIYYSGTILKMAGFPVKYAIWLVVVPNMIHFVASFIGLYLVERIGRRLLLITSLAGTIFGLAVLAVGFQLSETSAPSLNRTLVERTSNGSTVFECQTLHTTCKACVKDNSCGYCYSDDYDGTCLPSHDEERSSAGRCDASISMSQGPDFKWAYEFCPSEYTWLSMLGMAVFVFAFAPGLGPMPWTINSEIYPLWARSTCISLAACTAWLNNLVISFTFLTMTEHITIYGTFWLFAVISLFGLVFIYLTLPETKDKTLEEMEQLFMTSKARKELAKSRDQKLDNKV